MKNKFKVGDKVFVARRVLSWSGNSWVPIMDRYVGQVSLVSSISDTGVVLCECRRWLFPAEALEPVANVGDTVVSRRTGSRYTVAKVDGIGVYDDDSIRYGNIAILHGEYTIVESAADRAKARACREIMDHTGVEEHAKWGPWQPTEQDYRECCGMWVPKPGDVCFENRLMVTPGYLVLHHDSKDHFNRKMGDWTKLEPIPEQCIPKPPVEKERYPWADKLQEWLP
jgi:hypothetical protein